MTVAQEGSEWSAARPGRTLPPKKTPYPLYRRLGEPHGRSGRAGNLVRTGIRFRAHIPCIMLKILGATVQNSTTGTIKGWGACSNADYNCYENSYKTELQALLFWRRSRTRTLGPALSLPSVADEKAFLTADDHSHRPTCHPTALWMHQIPKSLARLQL